MSSASPQDPDQQKHQQEPFSQQYKSSGNTLTKEEQRELMMAFLPACQPQEGSPANTLTMGERKDFLRQAYANMQIGPRNKDDDDASNKKTSPSNKIDICDLKQWEAPAASTSAPVVSGNDDVAVDAEDDVVEATPEKPCDELDWFGAPPLGKNVHLTRAFRERVRRGDYTSTTNGVCPGFLQCNLVVLPQGPAAFDFLLFCQRNPKACPLIEVCDVGSPHCPGVAPGADLRTDIPRYAIYRDGKLDKEVTDVTEHWPEQSVAFLIGCSFSYDGALLDANIPLKSADQGRNVPMYNTNIKCRPAGSLKGTMVVSMKPIPALKVSKHIEITSKYTHAHGGPVTVGSSSSIGIKDIMNPEWGDSIDIADDEVPVFHACGVTPQSILMESKVPFAITHSAGHMFVTDLPSDMGV